MIKSNKNILRSGFSSQWATVNPKLELGEIGYEIDTKTVKVGDGEYKWDNLAYINCYGVVDSPAVTADSYKISSDMIVTESSLSRTLSSADNGKVILCTNASDITISVDTSVGTVGFSVTVIQNGTGKVSFSASGTTINNRQSHTKTAGRYAIVSLICTGTNTFILAGDTGT